MKIKSVLKFLILIMVLFIFGCLRDINPSLSHSTQLNDVLQLDIVTNKSVFHLKDTIVVKVSFQNLDNDTVFLYYHPYGIQLMRIGPISTAMHPIFPSPNLNDMEEALNGKTIQICPKDSAVRILSLPNLKYKFSTVPGTIKVYALYRYNTVEHNQDYWTGIAISDTLSLKFIE